MWQVIFIFKKKRSFPNARDVIVVTKKNLIYTLQKYKPKTRGWMDVCASTAGENEKATERNEIKFVEYILKLFTDPYILDARQLIQRQLSNFVRSRCLVFQLNVTDLHFR